MSTLKFIEAVSLETPPRLPASGGNFAMVKDDRVHISVFGEGLTWEQAQTLRNWLTRAVDDEPGSFEPDV
jgi:hypothetical protein